MSTSYKSKGYNTFSPYLIVNEVDCDESGVGGMNKRFALHRYQILTLTGAL